jgi:hypothetical protein
MKVKETILDEINAYIDGRIYELSELARKYAIIDNYVEIARKKELQMAYKMIQKIRNRT